MPESAENCRDLRRSAFVTLNLICLVARCLLSWLRLSRRDTASKNVEILVLRHQLAVVQRQIPQRVLPRPVRPLLGTFAPSWPIGTSADASADHGAGASARGGESVLGISAYPR